MSAKSQKRRLRKKYPRKPRDMSGGLDWSGGANEDPIASFHRAIEASVYGSDRRRSEPGTAELADENEPEGAVILKDSKGHVTAMMPRSVYDHFRGS